jgi:hypothetical protein
MSKLVDLIGTMIAGLRFLQLSAERPRESNPRDQHGRCIAPSRQGC